MIIIIKFGKNIYKNGFGGDGMRKVCPLCNNLEIKHWKCEKCSAIMEDKGITQEFSDDYTANMEIDDSEQFCVHMFKCSNCNFHERIKVFKISI